MNEKSVNRTETLPQFHFSKLSFVIGFMKSGRVPEFKSSAFRGGIGQMLLRMFCVCPEKQDAECDNCLCRGRCIVQNIMYAPFRIKPEYVTDKESAGFTLYCGDDRTAVKKGDRITLEMVMFGDMVSFFYPILQALHMLGLEGLGHDRIPFSIACVENRNGNAIVEGMDIRNDRILVDNSIDYLKSRRNELGLGDVAETIRLDFLSPNVIKYHGEVMKSFEPEGIIAAIYRRVRMYSLFEGIDPGEPAMFEIPERFSQNSETVIAKRHSGRQREDIKLRGIQGWLEMQDVKKDVVDLLIMGEITGIGKNTKFGFGKYRVEKM